MSAAKTTGRSSHVANYNRIISPEVGAPRFCQSVLSSFPLTLLSNVRFFVGARGILFCKGTGDYGNLTILHDPLCPTNWDVWFPRCLPDLPRNHPSVFGKACSTLRRRVCVSSGNSGRQRRTIRSSIGGGLIPITWRRKNAVSVGDRRAS